MGSPSLALSHLCCGLCERHCSATDCRHTVSHGCEVKPRYQRLVTSAPRSDPSTLLMTRLVYRLEQSRRARRTTPWSTHPPHPVGYTLGGTRARLGLLLVLPSGSSLLGDGALILRPLWRGQCELLRERPRSGSGLGRVGSGHLPVRMYPRMRRMEASTIPHASSSSGSSPAASAASNRSLYAERAAHPAHRASVWTSSGVLGVVGRSRRSRRRRRALRAASKGRGSATGARARRRARIARFCRRAGVQPPQCGHCVSCRCVAAAALCASFGSVFL